MTDMPPCFGDYERGNSCCDGTDTDLACEINDLCEWYFRNREQRGLFPEGSDPTTIADVERVRTRQALEVLKPTQVATGRVRTSKHDEWDPKPARAARRRRKSKIARARCRVATYQTSLDSSKLISVFETALIDAIGKKYFRDEKSVLVKDGKIFRHVIWRAWSADITWCVARLRGGDTRIARAVSLPFKGRINIQIPFGVETVRIGENLRKILHPRVSQNPNWPTVFFGLDAQGARIAAVILVRTMRRNRHG